MLPILIVLAVLAVVLLVALELGRRRRDAALSPVRLGPSWRPSRDGTSGDPRDLEAVASRADDVAARSGVERATVARILDVWDEYLGVLGLAPLAADHERLVYDPYDPPVAQRGPDGAPVPDPQRVARDAAGRLGIAETVAIEVLEVATSGDTTRGEDASRSEDAPRG